MQEWQKHIRHTHEDKKTTAWCGVRLYSYDWAFTDIDHAAYSIETSRLLTCSECCKAVIECLSASVTEIEEP